MAEEIGFENGRNSNFEGLVTLTLTLDPVIRHTVVHHSSTSTYIPNFIEIKETLCGRTDVRTDVQTDIFPPSNIIRSTFGSRPNKRELILSSLSVLTAIFQVNPGLVGLTEAKDDGSGGDNWSCKSCKAPVKLSPPTKPTPSFLQKQSKAKQSKAKQSKARWNWAKAVASMPLCFCYRPDVLPVAQPTVSKHWREKSNFAEVLTPSSPGVFQRCLWPLIAPGYLGGGLPWLSSRTDTELKSDNANQLTRWPSGRCNTLVVLRFLSENSHNHHQTSSPSSLLTILFLSITISIHNKARTWLFITSTVLYCTKDFFFTD